MDIKYTGNTTLNALVDLIKALFIKTSDVVDSCDSTDASTPLSANQGNVLQAQIEKINESVVPATIDEVKEYLNI